MSELQAGSPLGRPLLNTGLGHPAPFCAELTGASLASWRPDGLALGDRYRGGEPEKESPAAKGWAGLVQYPVNLR